MKDFLTTKVAKDTKTGQRVFFLRALRVLRGRTPAFGCGSDSERYRDAVALQILEWK